jgi:4-amino-4-deoxy-L-arabinose transferase-like glycosyltransferase
MTETYKKQKNLLISLILSTLFVFIASVSWYIYNSEKQHLVFVNSERLDIEVELLGSYLSDLIARYDYAELKNYLDMVIKKNSEITHLKITLDNGKEIYTHNEKITPLYQSKKFTIGNQSFTVACSHRTVTLDEHLNQLKLFLTFFVILFTTTSGFTLWYILSKWILRPLDDQITEKTKEIKNFSSYLSSIINSLDSHIVIVDKKGNIVRTNDAWKNFAKENGYIGDPSMFGKSYLHECSLDDMSDCNNEYEKRSY